MPQASIKEIDTQRFSDPSASVRRSRFIDSSSTADGGFIDPDFIRFEDGSRRHPIVIGKKIPPIMRPRGVPERGQPRYSDIYYAVANLLFCNGHVLPECSR